MIRIHHIPELHGTLTLSEGEIALFGNDIPKEVKEEAHEPSLLGIIYLIREQSVNSVLFVYFQNLPFDMSLSELKDEQFLTHVKKGMEKRLNALAQQFSGIDYSHRWLEATLNREKRTMFSTIELTVNGKVSFLPNASKFGNKCMIAFKSETSEAKSAFLKEQLRLLVENFKFDTEYEYVEKPVDVKFIGIFLLILCGLAILLLFALIFAIKARRSARSGNKKLTAELGISFIISIVNSTFSMFNKPPHIPDIPELIGYILGYVMVGTLIIFFVFFFWTWNAQFAQSKPARNIISLLTGLTIIIFIGVSIYLIFDCFKNKSLENVLTVCILLALLSFILWKYVRIMRNNNISSMADTKL